MMHLCYLLYVLCFLMKTEARVGKADIPSQRNILVNTQNSELEDQTAVTMEKGLLTLWYNSSNTRVATYTFDFCNIVPCHSDSGWQCERYHSSPGYSSIYICMTSEVWGNECKNWGAVAWNTEMAWNYAPVGIERRVDKKGRNLRCRMVIFKSGTCLPNGKLGNNMRLTLTITNPSMYDAGLYLLGAWIKNHRSDPLGQFYIKDMFKSAEWTTYKHGPEVPELKNIVTMANPSYGDTVATETGYGDLNLWLEWMRYSVKQVNKSNCYVCGQARPHLGTVPLTLPQPEMSCIMRMYANISTNYSVCKCWEDQYPVISDLIPIKERVTIYKGNYTCHYNYGSTGKVVGNFSRGYCGSRINSFNGWAQHQTIALGDVYWFCGDLVLRRRLPRDGWIGECALAKAIMPIHVFVDTSPEEEEEAPSSALARLRVRRDKQPLGSFDPHVYIDAIGVPRGVPSEFKARDQVAAGFESLIPMITISKTVDWVNYLYYNQQRFVNYSRDALQGLAEQLGPTSEMAFQNRMALDMILAEKGGVCKMLKGTGSCCTYIPDNTGPTGKVTRAIRKLSDLSEELKRNSGVADPWDQYFGWLNNWKPFLVQTGVTILIVFILIVVVTSCVIPCIRKLVLRVVSINSTSTALVYTSGETEDLYTRTEAIPTVPLVML